MTMAHLSGGTGSGSPSERPPAETGCTRGVSDDLAAYYREVLVTHYADPGTGRCPVCHVPHCPAWIEAYDRLAAANQLMGEPRRWADSTTTALLTGPVKRMPPHSRNQ
jgi:hypothetical protein